MILTKPLAGTFKGGAHFSPPPPPFGGIFAKDLRDSGPPLLKMSGSTPVYGGVMHISRTGTKQLMIE